MTAPDLDPDELVAYADALKDLAEALRRAGTLGQAVGSSLTQLGASGPRFTKVCHNGEWGFIEAGRPGVWAPFGLGDEAEVDKVIADLYAGTESVAAFYFDPLP